MDRLGQLTGGHTAGQRRGQLTDQIRGMRYRELSPQQTPIGPRS